MENSTTWDKAKKFTMMLSGLLVAIGTIGTGVIWLFAEKIDNHIMDVVEEQKGPSLRVDFSKKMDIDTEDVDNEIGWMYNTMIEMSTSKDDMAIKWAPHLEKELKWRAVGYFVNVADPTTVKYHHKNGKIYDAWTDENGLLYYIKDGYKYY